MINDHLASCYSWGTTSRNISNSALRQGGASLWRYIWCWRVGPAAELPPAESFWVYRLSDISKHVLGWPHFALKMAPWCVGIWTPI